MAREGSFKCEPLCQLLGRQARALRNDGTRQGERRYFTVFEAERCRARNEGAVGRGGQEEVVARATGRDSAVRVFQPSLMGVSVSVTNVGMRSRTAAVSIAGV